MAGLNTIAAASSTLADYHARRRGELATEPPYFPVQE